jgi:hypothetical protein
MPLAQALARFKVDVVQCESLIANAHKLDNAGAPILPPIDQQQITVAAFLNMFKAWEAFLETSIGHLMIGSSTISGRAPVRFVTPADLGRATRIIVGIARYFDYANHQYVRRIADIYFDQGYPLEPHLASINSDLDDLRTMRNASAHIAASTQTALEALATSLFGQPRPGITLYQLLTTPDPRSPTHETVFSTYKEKLIVTAELIAQG